MTATLLTMKLQHILRNPIKVHVALSISRRINSLEGKKLIENDRLIVKNKTFGGKKLISIVTLLKIVLKFRVKW